MRESDLINAIKRSENWLQSEMDTWLISVINEPSSIMFRKLKAIIEIGYLEFFTNPHPNEEIKNRVKTIVFELIKSNSFMSLARHNIEHSNLFIPLLAIYLSTNSTDENKKRDVINLIKCNLFSSKEKTPFREIDLLHITYKITQETSFLKNAHKVAKFGSVGKFKNIHSFSNSDDYALTHTIFYLTDFGKIEWNEHILSKKKLCFLLNVLCEQAKLINDIDIFGEYILCKQYLNFPFKEIEVDIAELLKMQNREFGFWQGPTDLKKVLSKEGFEESALCFFENYHTSIVVRLVLCNQISKHTISNFTLQEQPLIRKKSLNSNKIFSLNKHLVNKRLDKDYIELFRILLDYNQTHNLIIPENIIQSPNLILLCSDILYTCKNESFILEKYFKLFENFLNIDVYNQNFDVRFVRIWCSINLIFDTKKKYDIEKLISKYNLLSLNDEDSIIILLMLFDKCPITVQTEIQSILNSFYAKSIIEKNLRAVNYILIYADFKNIQLFFTEILDLFLSMNSITLPFGWLEVSNSETSNFYDILSFLTAIKLERSKKVKINIT
jgi:hypothetical protein